jgi:hypothetical protein
MLFIKLVGNMQQNACAIAGFVIGAFRSPVFHTFQNLKAPVQNIVRPAALHIRHKANPAGIMLVFAPVQARSFGKGTACPRISAHNGSFFLSYRYKSMYRI